MISLIDLSISVEGRILLNNVNVTFLNSSITYLQGPNGSGKTSMLRILAGIMVPVTGEINYKNQHKINYIGHDLGLKSELTVMDHLQFWTNTYNSIEALEASVYYFGLNQLLDKKIYELSAGNQKKVALAKLLACQANLWLLDEADVNLDIANKQLLDDLIISKANNGGIIILTSHNNVFIKGSNLLNLIDFK